MSIRTTKGSLIAAIAIMVAGLVASATALAQTSGEGLTGIPLDSYANDVERSAAIANQATFERIDPSCNPGGIFDQVPDPDPSVTLPGCEGDIFSAYLSIRKLVHTANELTGNGPTAASMSLDQANLGTALRWTAAEELAAQGSAATEFAGNQLSNLAARMNALRFGATGFTVTGLFDPAATGEGLVASSNGYPRGGAASADDSGNAYSPWGGFLNGSYGFGKKNDTDLENAFDFDGLEFTLGVDYRFQNNFVLGGLLGYKSQEIDFDEAASSVRVVDGGMDIDGISAMVFGLFQGERFYASGSIGMENLDYSVDRRIQYTSNNPNVAGANSIALSTPNASTLTGTFSFGYAFYSGRMSVEPYLNVEYLDIDIDAFIEERSIEVNGVPDPNAFNLQVAGQSFQSLDAIVGVRLQTTFSPEFGIVVPYAKLEAHNELLNESRTIFSGYGALSDVQNGQGLLNFAIPTDRIDTNYLSWAIGFSTVLRGGRQLSYDGPITGGLMAYFQFEGVEGLDNYKQHVVSAGVRYEF